MKPIIGKIVLYRLSQQDAEEITRRRTSGSLVAARIFKDRWPVGAQAHIGNPVIAGDVLPMLVVCVSNADYYPCNGQVFLDGCDVLWVTSRCYGSDPGEWTYSVTS